YINFDFGKASNQGRPIFYFASLAVSAVYSIREYYNLNLKVNSPSRGRQFISVYGAKMERCNTTEAYLQVSVFPTPFLTTTFSNTSFLASTEFSIPTIP